MRRLLPLLLLFGIVKQSCELDFCLYKTNKELSWDKSRSKIKYLAGKEFSRHLKCNRPQAMGSGFIFHVFAEGDFPCHVDADGIRTSNSLYHFLPMLNYFMWEMWMLGGMVLSPCYYKQCLIFSLPAFVPFRAHFIEGVFTSEKLKKYDKPELPTLNPQTRWQINTRSGVRVSYITHMYKYQIKLLKSCCIQWGAWVGHWCPQTQTSFKNCTQINHVQSWTNNILVLNLLGNF